jgi:hypothetical protein
VYKQYLPLYKRYSDTEQKISQNLALARQNRQKNTVFIRMAEKLRIVIFTPWYVVLLYNIQLLKFSDQLNVKSIEPLSN